MSHSLRRHLSWALAGPMLLAVLGGALAYRVATGVVGEAYDASLLNLAEGAANNVRVVDGRLVLDMPGEAERLLRTDRSDRIFYRVRSDAGEASSRFGLTLAACSAVSVAAAAAGMT